MKLAWLALLAACGGDGGGGGPGLTATTSFVVTSVTGAGMSPLDPLAMQTIDLQIVFPDFAVDRGYEGDTTECKSTTLWTFPADRTASGASAQLVQTQILDMLAYWDVRLQLCTQGTSSILLHSEIDELNLAYGCFGIPASAMVRGSDGYPQLTSFVATRCSATILDVVTNRVLQNPSFEISFQLASAHLP